MSAITNLMNTMSAWRLFAWVLLIVAAVAGSSMIAVALFEEFPSIMKWTFQRTIRR